MPFLGALLTVSAPEDTILAKLRWSRLSGGSAKQINDAKGVLAFQRESLDWGYLDTWARHLKVEQELSEL